jgi:hypothetical protein
MMTVTEVYKHAAAAGLVFAPDPASIRRAQRYFRRNKSDSGYCLDAGTLLGLAIAEADVGHQLGWLPVVQRIGMEIARMLDNYETKGAW